MMANWESSKMNEILMDKYVFISIIKILNKLHYNFM
jgi:hypothetical protein